MMKWLTWSWRIGRIREVEIRFHFSVLFSIIAAYSIFHPVDLRRGSLALLSLMGFLLSIFLHELGHTLAAKLVGIEVKSIVIWLLGGFTNLRREPEKPLHRLAVYAAGPIMTFLLGALFFVAYFYLPDNLPFFGMYIYTRLFLLFALLNVILFIFNVLPVFPLDGGRILHALSELLFGQSNANLITMIVSIPVLLGLIVLGIYTHDYVLLGSSIFIALAISTLNRHTLRWADLGVNYLFKRGGYYFLRGDYDRAEWYYTRDIEREPQQASHYIARSVCYFWMIEKQKALADIERARELAPNHEVVLLLRADLYALDKKYDAALDLITQAQQLKPDWAHTHMDCGSVLMHRGEFQPALDEFNKAISLLGQIPIPLFYVERSMAHFKLGNLEAAHKDEDLALRLSEKDALTRAEFSLLAYEGHLDWAEDFYGRVLLKRPRSWYAYQGRADAYRVNGEHDKAIADYTSALEIKPREPRLYLGRGKSYQAKGDVDCARADFRQVSIVTEKMHYRRQAEILLKSLQGQ